VGPGRYPVAKDRQAYVQKIQELETFFNNQLSRPIKTRARAQRTGRGLEAGARRWQQTLTQQTKESRQTEELQSLTQTAIRAASGTTGRRNGGSRRNLAEMQKIQGDLEQQYQADAASMETQPRSGRG